MTHDFYRNIRSPPGGLNQAAAAAGARGMSNRRDLW